MRIYMEGMNLSDSVHAKRKTHQLKSLRVWLKDPRNYPEDIEIIERQIDWCVNDVAPYGDLVGWMGCTEDAPDFLETLQRSRESCSQRLERAREYNFTFTEALTAELEDIDMQIHGVSRVAAMVKRGGAPMLCAHAYDCD